MVGVLWCYGLDMKCNGDGQICEDGKVILQREIKMAVMCGREWWFSMVVVL